jgi:hypothetical protein
MRLSPAFAASAAIAAIAGCGPHEAPPPAGCSVDSDSLELALLKAPQKVALPGGARLSQCVARARSDAQLQDTGRLLTQVADRLARHAARDPRSALALGYLIGAARRGAAQSQDVHAELVHRLERSGAELEREGGARRAALHRGVAAGERSG